MRKVLVGLGILALVVMVVMFGAGWYYSSQIIDGSSIEGSTDNFANEVAAVEVEGNRGTITYTVDPDVEDPATDDYTEAKTGMKFADGTYLLLEQGAVVDGRSITRGYTLLAGEPPAAGDLGQYDWSSYPDAGVLGLVHRQVTYEAPGGPTPAIIVDPEGAAAATWVIVVHGRGATVREGLRAVDEYAVRGMTTMLINYRDDLKEPGAPYEDGIGNWGYTEWPDLAAAVEYAVAQRAQDVVLVGWSMGGGIIAAYLENGANTGVVRATMMHSPMLNFHDTVVHQAQEMGLPTGPLTPVIWLAERLTELRVDIDFGASDYVDNAATWPVPALVTSASEDQTVATAPIEQFADALPDGEFAQFAGASHTGEWNYDSDRFDELVGNWLDENVARR